jgi:WD40 repeat protein
MTTGGAEGAFFGSFLRVVALLSLAQVAWAGAVLPSPAALPAFNRQVSHPEGDKYPFRGATYGHNVAASADKQWVLVGAYDESSCRMSNPLDIGCQAAGAAYVYQYSAATGAFSLFGYLKASNPVNGSTFGDGAAFSNDGSVLAVGAVGHMSNFSGVINGATGGADETSVGTVVGAVFVFQRNGNVYNQVAFIKPQTTYTHMPPRFGYVNSIGLSADGKVMVVGSGGIGATVYVNSGGIWKLDAEVMTELNLVAVALAPDASFFVGSSDPNPAGAIASWVFTRGGPGVWNVSAAPLSASGTQIDNRRLSLSNDARTVAVATDIGATVFRFDGTSWLPGIVLDCNYRCAQNCFATSVALSANGAFLAIGIAGPTDTGAICTFVQSSQDVWVKQSIVTVDGLPVASKKWRWFLSSIPTRSHCTFQARWAIPLFLPAPE